MCFLADDSITCVSYIAIREKMTRKGQKRRSVGRWALGHSYGGGPRCTRYSRGSVLSRVSHAKVHASHGNSSRHHIVLDSDRRKQRALFAIRERTGAPSAELHKRRPLVLSRSQSIDPFDVPRTEIQHSLSNRPLSSR